MFKASIFFCQPKLLAKEYSISLICYVLLVLAMTNISCSQSSNTTQSILENDTKTVPDFWPKIPPAIPKNNNVEAKVNELVTQMTLEQKVAQMIQPEIKDFTVEDMRKYGFGSYLNGGGAFPNNNKHSTIDDWITLAESMYQASMDDSIDGLRIPTMWGTDAVHGHNNVMGATLFPHNIALGATHNPELISKIAKITAKEVMVTGIDWIFAPTVAVVQDDRWGRTYEGYSENPDVVRNYAYAMVKGLQGDPNDDFLSDDHVISTVKHFIGDGGTELGDDQGDNIANEQTLFDIHAQGYVGGLSAGAQSVMASFNSWHGSKVHGNKYLLTKILKERMGFDGFVVGDWNGHGQIAGCSNESCPQAINAGLDIFMVPTKAWKPLYYNTIAQVKSGEIPLSRIDDAVRRILRVKMRAGLFDKPSPAQRKLSGKKHLLGHELHRNIARQAVRESLVLLKNNQQLLPLSPKSSILVAGDGANNIMKQSGGWSVSWQGTGNSNSDFPGGHSIFDGIKQQVDAAGGKATLSVDASFTEKPDVAIVVFGEDPYAEGHGDLDNLEFQRGNKTDIYLLRQLKAQGIPVVSIFISGRPLWVNPELNASDAFVAAWLPGSEGDGIAQVLFRDQHNNIQHDFVGKLPFSWPASVEQAVNNFYQEDYQPLFAYGYGLSYQDNKQITNTLDETVDVSYDQLDTMKIFVGATKAPWKEKLSTKGDFIEISSSVEQYQGIRYRTLDKKVQEDARMVTFSGESMQHMAIFSDFPSDFRAYYEANSVLNFSLNIDSEQPLSNSTTLDIVCDEECTTSIPLSTLLAKYQRRTTIQQDHQTASKNQWYDISIDLHCFKEQGVNFSRIVSPFQLSSQQALSISFADVTLVPNSGDATMQCKK